MPNGVFRELHASNLSQALKNYLQENAQLSWGDLNAKLRVACAENGQFLRIILSPAVYESAKVHLTELKLPPAISNEREQMIIQLKREDYERLQQRGEDFEGMEKLSPVNQAQSGVAFSAFSLSRPSGPPISRTPPPPPKPSTWTSPGSSSRARALSTHGFLGASSSSDQAASQVSSAQLVSSSGSPVSGGSSSSLLSRRNSVEEAVSSPPLDWIRQALNLIYSEVRSNQYNTLGKGAFGPKIPQHIVKLRAAILEYCLNDPLRASVENCYQCLGDVVDILCQALSRKPSSRRHVEVQRCYVEMASSLLGYDALKNYHSTGDLRENKLAKNTLKKGESIYDRVEVSVERGNTILTERMQEKEAQLSQPTGLKK